jgi:3',5'-cyclic AMP phosphodiesterase CpdA
MARRRVANPDNLITSTAFFRARFAHSGIYRETMTQPGVYWLLDAPLDRSQLDWFEQTLKRLSDDRTSKALIIATHHPPYSSAGHTGSAENRCSLQVDGGDP